MAWFLNGEEFSIGAHTHMYVFFSPTTPIGTASVVEQGMDWWFRYTYVGAPRELARSPETSLLLEEGVIAALKANRPDKAELIDAAAATVRAHGERMRFLLKFKETKAYVAETAFTISEREPAKVRTLRTEKSTGAMFDSPPILAIDARVHVNESLGIPFSEYAPCSERPPISKIVKWQGVVSPA
ncbi:hypothetical protein U91I_01134 [alpha proteobacterium U9-1i]|nr:hypothetical protein U91I_01134 [alpha proteobacterium U9-1i]